MPRPFRPLLLAALLCLGGLVSCARTPSGVSSLSVWMTNGPNRLYARDGQFVGTLAPYLPNGKHLDRDVLALKQISPLLRGAVVTAEDRRFYQHGALDWRGLGRALLSTLGGKLEGGSTITQQLVKNTLLSGQAGARTPARKVREALLAREVERAYGKDQILGAYLNVVYWGAGGPGGVTGAQEAARAYFGVDAADLDLAQSAYLATLLPAPARFLDYAAYRPLLRDLLARMVADGRVTAAQADEAWREPLEPAGWRADYGAGGNLLGAALVDREARARNLAAGRLPAHPHYFAAVERELVAGLGAATVARGGLQVQTGLDLQTQLAAEQASRDASLPSGATLGLALVEPASGQVLALVGQKLDGNAPSAWDNATRARRQVGSSVKPFLYTLALEQGFKQTDTLLDAPLTGTYQPQNYDGRFLGVPVTLRYALDHSLNLPSARLAQQVGVSNLASKLTELGFTPPKNAGLSLALGTLEASPLQMAAAYATFASGGVWNEPRFVTRVLDAGGRDLNLPAPQSRRVWDEQTAALGLDMLRGVVNDLGPSDGGLAWRARLPGWDVGGKTGTTNDVKDLWFAGVTPGMAGAVWVGKQAGGALPQNAYSGDICTAVWQQAVAGALAGRAPESFGLPPGVVQVLIDGAPMTFREGDAEAQQAAQDFWTAPGGAPQDTPWSQNWSSQDGSGPPWP